MRVGWRNLELDPVGRFDRDRMRVAERQLEVTAAQLRPVADALDLEALLEAGCHALHHVGHQRPGQPVQRAMLATIGRAGHHDLTSSTCSTAMSRWIRSDSSPLGPLTVTLSGSIAMVTPAGTDWLPTDP